jgi:hypothetical protein
MSDRALARLRDPDGAALRALARMVVEEATETPVRALARPDWIAGQIETALEAVSRGDGPRDKLVAQIVRVRRQAIDDHRPLRTWFPSEVDAPLRQMLSRPWSPDRALVSRIIDQEAVRTLVRDVLRDALIRFSKRLRSDRLSRLGSKAAERSRGLLGRMAGNSLPNLGGLAENLVGTVAEEVEHQLEARVDEFVRGATGEAIEAIAAHLASPKHARAYADLRVEVLDVLLASTASTVAKEAEKLAPEELVDVVLAAVRSEVRAPDFRARTEERVAAALESAGEQSLGALLDELGLREVWTETTCTLVTARLSAVVVTDAFAAWWSELHADA